MQHPDWQLLTDEETAEIAPFYYPEQGQNATTENANLDPLYTAHRTPHRTMVQTLLFEKDPRFEEERQAYFSRLPRALIQHFSKAYLRKLNDRDSFEAFAWYKAEMAKKMPRIEAVMTQYGDFFQFLKEGQKDLSFLDGLEEGLDVGLTTEQAVEIIQQNAKNKGVKLPMHIARLNASGKYLKQHQIRPLAYQTEDQIKEVALVIAFQFKQTQEQELEQNQHKATDHATAYAVLLDCYRKMQAKMNRLQLDAPYQRKADKGNIKPEEMETGFLKMTCEKYWTRKLLTLSKRMREHLAIACGQVNTLAPYCSNSRLKEFQAQRKANIEYLKAMIITNIAEPEEQLALFDSWLKSASNPKIKRLELLTRMNGYEQWAEEQKHDGWFITLTAPSAYHAMLSKTQDINPKWNGASPEETQKYLVNTWAKIRAKLNREGVMTYGFRVAEPHADATPHWHLILFTKPSDMQRLRQVILRYALEKDGNEAGAKKYRCKFKRIDREKGTATGYLIKYVSKNIDGFGMDGELSDEANIKAKDNAARVQAWSSLWGIRQFQQLGNTPISVWRELRRLGDLEQEDETLENLRKLADEGNWKGYTEALGGALVKRNDLTARLTYTERKDENGNAAYTLYKEPSLKVNGLKNPFTGAMITTRLKDWKISLKPKNWEEKQREKQLAQQLAKLPEAQRAEAESEARAEARAKELEKLGYNQEAQALLGELLDDERGDSPLGLVSVTVRGEKINSVPEVIRERIKNELIIMKGRVTEQQIDDLLNGKRLIVWNGEKETIYARFSRGQLFQEIEEKQEF